MVSTAAGIVMKATVAVLALGVVCSACTSGTPSPTTESPIPPTSVVTSTRPVVDPANWKMTEFVDGATLGWDLAVESDLVPFRMATVADTVFVMATSAREGGLWVWSTKDGLTWQDHGQVVPAGSEIGAVGSTGDELLVAIAEGLGAGPRVMRSEDGIIWRTDDLPFDRGNPMLAFQPSAIGGSADLSLVAGTLALEPSGYVAGRFADVFPTEVDPAAVGVVWEESGDDILVRLTAPPGFTIAETTAAELGLTDQDRGWLTDGAPAGLSLWTDLADAGWVSGQLAEANSAAAVFDAPDGEVFLSTAIRPSSAEDHEIFRSFDGLTWERLTSGERPLTVAAWSDSRIGPSASGESDLIVSSDGLDWSRTNLALRFPAEPVFTVTHAAAGRPGIVATVESFDWTYADPGDDSVSAALEKDGLTVRISDLTFGPQGLIDGPHDVVVYEGERSVADPHLYPIAGPPDRDDLSVDAAAGTITFHDDDGSDLLTVSFEEMDDLLYRTLAPTRHFERAHSHALAHTTDTVEWTLWDLAEVVGGDYVGDVGVSGEIALLMVDQGEGGGFQLWATTLP